MKSYIDLTMNKPDLSQGEMVNFSVNTLFGRKHYIEFPQATVKQDGWELPPPKFKAFDYDKWEQL